MKINLDRLCRLAGIEEKSAESLNEVANRSYHDDPALDAEREVQYANQLNEMDEDEVEEADHVEEAMAAYEAEEAEEGDDTEEGSYMEDDIGSDASEMVMEDLDEVIEVDEAMLVQELRRARAMLSEAKQASAEDTPGDLTEAQLQRIIADEVANAMKDFNLTGGWVYGEDKPQNSKRGQVITSMPGIGFKSFNHK